MRNERGGIVITFPTERNGYQQDAVDARIKELELALGQLQARVTEGAEKHTKLEQENSALRAASEAASLREAAISAALVTIEQQRIQAAKDIDIQRDTAYQESERLLEAARAEAATIVAEAEASAAATAESARRAAEDAVADARAECESQHERLEALEADYDRRLTQVRREVSALLELLPRPRQAAPGLLPTAAVVTTLAEPVAALAQVG